MERGGGTGGGGTATSALLHANGYTYDNAGQRLTNTISWQGTGTSSGTTVSRTETYGYDNLSRLTSVDYGDGESQTYSFDAMGNRATKTDTVAGSGSIPTSTTSESYSVDAANRLTSRTVGTASATVTSDANGNTLTDGKRSNTWDSENRLVSCVSGGSGSNGTGSGSTTSAFVYGCDGLRKRGTVTNADGTKTRTDYIYDGSMMVEEVVQHFSATGGTLDSPTTITYFQGPQGPLYRKASTEADPHWYIYDGLGSVVGEVDPLGNVTASKLFDVYGATRGGSGTPTTRQGFVGGLGHQTDDETGLVYMRARYYDPNIGRFVSQDSAKDGSNWFQYCKCNPTNLTDSNGKSPTTLNSMQWIATSSGTLFAAYSLILMASIAAGGLSKGYIIFAVLIAAGGIVLIADGLKDVLIGEPGANALVLSAAGYVLNLAFNRVSTQSLELMGQSLPALGNLVASILATAVIDMAYICTMG